ncbi:hypothetical protein MIR68_002062, partial [Amoeboaphelidium protococcarum]
KLCVAVLEKGLYRIVIEQPQKVLNVVNLISQHAQPPQSVMVNYQTLHRRLGHPSEKLVNKL